MYKTLLLASDLTEQSNAIAKKAQSIADTVGAELHVVHVVEPVGAYGGGLYYLGDLNEEIQQQAKESLHQLAKELKINLDHCHLMLGHTKHEVLKVAKDIRADLIVLGTHGAKGFAALLGSTATSVLNSAECDVLTVPINNV